MIEKIVILLVVGVIALMFFGNRLPQVLGDLGKGVRAFKDGMSGGEGGEGAAKKRKPATGAKTGRTAKSGKK